jgi:hypothetical protein
VQPSPSDDKQPSPTADVQPSTSTTEGIDHQLESNWAIEKFVSHRWKTLKKNESYRLGGNPMMKLVTHMNLSYMPHKITQFYFGNTCKMPPIRVKS